MKEELFFYFATNESIQAIEWEEFWEVLCEEADYYCKRYKKGKWIDVIDLFE